MSKAPLIHAEHLTINFWALEPGMTATPEIGKLVVTASEKGAAPFSEFTAPAAGARWPEQGGIYAGIRQYPDGKLYHLIFAERDVGPHTWGGEGKDTDAGDRNDGLENGGRLLNDPGYYPAAMAAAEYEPEGRAELDFYLPAIGELAQAWQTIGPHLGSEKAYWSSTQHTPGYAFIVDFDGGYQGGCVMTSERFVRPCRRFPVADAFSILRRKGRGH